MRIIKYAAEIVRQDGNDITIRFECDGFAFGTEETLDEITIPIVELLDLMQKADDQKYKADGDE